MLNNRLLNIFYTRLDLDNTSIMRFTASLYQRRQSRRRDQFNTRSSKPSIRLSRSIRRSTSRSQSIQRKRFMLPKRNNKNIKRSRRRSRRKFIQRSLLLLLRRSLNYQKLLQRYCKQRKLKLKLRHPNLNKLFPRFMLHQKQPFLSLKRSQRLRFNKFRKPNLSRTKFKIFNKLYPRKQCKPQLSLLAWLKLLAPKRNLHNRLYKRSLKKLQLLFKLRLLLRKLPNLRLPKLSPRQKPNNQSLRRSLTSTVTL